jgi:hypothetical protein
VADPEIVDVTYPQEDPATRGVPAQEKTRYTCPYPDCGAYAFQQRGGLLQQIEGEEGNTWLGGWILHRCSGCQRPIMWRQVGEGKFTMAFPTGVVGSPPSEDMPQDVAEIYEEARRVAVSSRRSAAALLRLALQMLIDHLEPGRGDLNSKIGKLAQRGLLPHIQQAMDVLRVVGNNAVHPGQIVLDDDPELLLSLFRLTNVVVDQMITAPEHAKSLFESLPEQARAQVSRRDGAAATVPES